MELTGKVIIELQREEGVSRAGNPWKKQSWILETFGTYPRKVKVDIFGNKLDTLRLEVGKSYTLSVDAESREYNGRWYTDISCYAAREGIDQLNAPQQPQSAPVPPFGGNPITGNDPFTNGGGAPGGAAFVAPNTQNAPFGNDPFAAGQDGAGAGFENSSDDLPF